MLTTQVTVSTLLFDLDMNFLYAVALLLSAASLGVYYSDLISTALEARRAARRVCKRSLAASARTDPGVVAAVPVRTRAAAFGLARQHVATCRGRDFLALPRRRREPRNSLRRTISS